MAFMRSTISFAARSCLYNNALRPVRSPSRARKWLSTKAKQWSTPLAQQLSEAIMATGPIPLASFMRMCMTSDQGGYYTSAQHGRDQFGQKGDFVTSPEISQIFGELIGIWFVAEWMAQGRRKKGIELMEIGPGRGTLMDDMLRTLRNFNPMASSIDVIYMVEASPSLRETQKTLLCGDAPMIENSIGFQSTSKYAKIPIIWTENIRFVPNNPAKTPFIIAHEFFDALPIHVFQSIAPQQDSSFTIKTPTGQYELNTEATSQSNNPQWREMVVSPTPPDATHASSNTPESQQIQSASPEFQLTLSKASTPHSLYLPEISSRYKALQALPGSLIEISPESHAYTQEFSKRIGGSSDAPKATPSGAALIIDYGPSDTIPINSLRGIQGHRRVSPLSSPGLVDLSADVDFTALAEVALESSPGIEVHGPVEQGAFLLGMGIRERAEMLLRNSKMDEEKKKRVDDAWHRLIDRSGSGMGKVYKVMAILPETGGIRRPVGFGGDVVSP